MPVKGSDTTSPRRKGTLARAPPTRTVRSTIPTVITPPCEEGGPAWPCSICPSTNCATTAAVRWNRRTSTRSGRRPSTRPASHDLDARFEPRPTTGLATVDVYDVTFAGLRRSPGQGLVRRCPPGTTRTAARGGGVHRLRRRARPAPHPSALGVGRLRALRDGHPGPGQRLGRRRHPRPGGQRVLVPRFHDPGHRGPARRSTTGACSPTRYVRWRPRAPIRWPTPRAPRPSVAARAAASRSPSAGWCPTSWRSRRTCRSSATSPARRRSPTATRTARWAATSRRTGAGPSGSTATLSLLRRGALRRARARTRAVLGGSGGPDLPAVDRLRRLQRLRRTQDKTIEVYDFNDHEGGGPFQEAAQLGWLPGKLTA